MPDRLEQLEKLHAADPADADITYMIAMEHVKAGDYPSVITWLDKTLAIDANYLYAYYQKAKAQDALDDTPAARVTLELGLEKANAAGDGKAISELNELLTSFE